MIVFESIVSCLYSTIDSQSKTIVILEELLVVGLLFPVVVESHSSQIKSTTATMPPSARHEVRTFRRVRRVPTRVSRKVFHFNFRVTFVFSTPMNHRQQLFSLVAAWC